MVSIWQDRKNEAANLKQAPKMGGQQAKASMPPEILQAEVELLMTKSRCSPEMERELDREIQVMMVSLDPTVKLAGHPTSALGRQILVQKAETEVKAVLLDRINEFRLSKEVDERFFDSNLFSVLGCLYGNAWIINRKLFEATASATHYFRVVNNLSIGQWGIVLKAKNGGSEMSFIIKTQTNPDESALSIHEAFVAMACMNPLRAFCPNFSYIYGGFVCGKPDGISAKICTGHVQVPYTIYENIEGPNFRQFIDTMPDTSNSSIRPVFNPFAPQNPPAVPPLEPSYLNVLSTLLQLFFALKIAHAKAFQFSHRDLHSENIILRPLKSVMVLKYDTNNFVFEDPIDRMKRRTGLLPPETPNFAARSVYYVKATHVATVIDYDMAEVYLPFVQPDGKLGVRRHGLDDHDPVGNVIWGVPAVSHIRDLAKLLGFTVNGVLNQKVSNEFKELLCDLYIDTIRPYYSIAKPQPQPPATIQDKVKLVVRDAANRFILTSNQVQKIREGVITFDKFLDNFGRLVPPQYIAELVSHYNISPFSDRDAEVDLYNKTKLTVLTCPGACRSEVETYRYLTEHSPAEDAARIALISQARPEVLAFQAVSDHLSRVRFKQSPARVLTNPSDSTSEVQYRALTDQRFDELARATTPEILRTIDSTIQIQSDLLGRMIGAVQLPDPFAFPAASDAIRPEIQRYRSALNLIFEIIKKMREIIALHNATVILGAPFAVSNRPAVLRISRAVEEFLVQSVYPWRNTIYQLSNAKRFGAANSQMSVVIATKFPTLITFDAIF